MYEDSWIDSLTCEDENIGTRCRYIVYYSYMTMTGDLDVFSFTVTRLSYSICPHTHQAGSTVCGFCSLLRGLRTDAPENVTPSFRRGEQNFVFDA